MLRQAVSEALELLSNRHSDRGCQYASNEYIAILTQYGIRTSTVGEHSDALSLSKCRTMTECGDPKDNAQAERINGTMKNELLKDVVFHHIDEVKAAVNVAVDFYNNERPHMSINMMTPKEAGGCSGEIAKKWTSYRLMAIKNRQMVTEPSRSKVLDVAENGLPLPHCQGSPSGLRPPVNP